MKLKRCLQSSLLLAVLSLSLSLPVFAAESQAASQASVSASSEAQVAGSSEASLKTSSESARASSSGAATQSSSDASGPSRAVNVVNPSVVSSGGGPVIKNIKTVPTHQSAASVKKRAPHWKTQYWNQKSSSRKPSH